MHGSMLDNGLRSNAFRESARVFDLNSRARLTNNDISGKHEVSMRQGIYDRLAHHTSWIIWDLDVLSTKTKPPDLAGRFNLGLKLLDQSEQGRRRDHPAFVLGTPTRRAEEYNLMGREMVADDPFMPKDEKTCYGQPMVAVKRLDGSDCKKHLLS